MKTADVIKLVEGTRTLPVDISDFAEGQTISDSNLTSGSKALLTYFKPILDKFDWTGGAFGCAPEYRKRAAEAAKLAACHAMLNRLRIGTKALAREATTAGVDLPTFTRQLLLVITRAYAQLFAMQLFGVIPLNGPTGRLHFKDYFYDSNFNGTVANPTPTVSQGDRTDDITKFNVDYYATLEGATANRIGYKYSNLDISTSSYRVIGEWTDEFADQAAAVYDDNAEASHMDHMSQEMARVVDRTLIKAVIDNVPSANTYTWTAQPTGTSGTVNYSTLDVANRREYDQTLVSDGFMTTINKIRVARKYANDGDPTWAVVGTDVSLALMKCSAFRPIDRFREMDVQAGALRDLGDVTSLGIRILVDPMLDSKTLLFGSKPMSKGDPGIYWAPFINMQPTRDRYDPEQGTTVRGVRSVFGVVKPITGTNAASSQLADIYGKLTIV